MILEGDEIESISLGLLRQRHHGIHLLGRRGDEGAKAQAMPVIGHDMPSSYER
jgi:hypothetical protein